MFETNTIIKKYYKSKSKVVSLLPKIFLINIVMVMLVTMASPVQSSFAQNQPTTDLPNNSATSKPPQNTTYTSPQISSLDLTYSTPALSALKDELANTQQVNPSMEGEYISKSSINSTVTTLINPDSQFLELGRKITFAGDGGPAINAEISSPNTIVADGKGGYYFTDTGNHRIRYVNPYGIITTVAGNGSDAARPNCWNNVKATDACLAFPHGISIDYDGGLIITDSFHHVISKVMSDGMLRVIAGSGARCFPGKSDCGIGQNALNASLDRPILAKRTLAGIVIADTSNRVLLVKNGIMTILAGTGNPGLSGDYGLATKADIFAPADVIPYRNGWLISDGNNCRLRWIDPQGIIKPFAGYGTNLNECWSWYGKVERTPGFQWGDAIKGDVGDGGPALNAKMTVTGFLVNVNDNIYFTDWLNNRVRHITPDGKIYTLVGTGEQGGTNGSGPMPGSQFRLGWACALAYDPTRNGLLLSDAGQRIMLVSLSPEKYSAIDAYWYKNGGSEGWIGPATGPETVGPSSNTKQRVYRSATIIWSQQTGAKVIYGGIKQKYDSLSPALKSQFGALLGDEEPGIGNGGRKSRFVGGDIYWTPRYGAKIIYGGIKLKYDSLSPALKSQFGALISDEEPSSNKGGRKSRFVGGDIYWTPQYSAQEIYGGIRAVYNALPWAAARLGAQTSGEVNGPINGSRATYFQSGVIIWSPQTGAKAVYGGIGAKYNSLPLNVKIALGLPTTDEINGALPSSRKSMFQRGGIYWHPTTNAHEVYGGIWARYNLLGAERSFLGLPTSGEKNGTIANSRINTFQKGTITWTPQTGAIAK